MASMDWLWFLLWIVTFGCAMFYWRKWREEARLDGPTHRLRIRYAVARQMAYDHYKSERLYEHGPFTFPTFEEWMKDAETD
ncbi:hypothetical protein FDH62_gp37 [Arthrobacter phage Pumancara]|uniref:Uncharacterized protein n=1 Tax=Arthrobacter phage Pumancara TaxID=1772311 RepID=A0A0U4JTK5_9CAUD|nr:hypothetical protein FDH62_gp37 [Arthrobacter phage Pumancara]ALY09995.1 hypothetical protein PUMANCARA_37 [Arthrobacter phage Pumancara]